MSEKKKHNGKISFQLIHSTNSVIISYHLVTITNSPDAVPAYRFSAKKHKVYILRIPDCFTKRKKLRRKKKYYTKTLILIEN